MQDGDKVQIWQLGGGNGRNLVEYYKCMGVACIGPSIEVNNWENLKKSAYSSREAGALWQFVKKLKPNDVVLVKSGRRSFILIGIVQDHNGATKYDRKEGVSVDGWDLGHQVKVDWYSIREDKEDEACSLVLKQNYSIPVIRFSKCHNGVTDQFRQICADGRIKGYLEQERTDIFKKEPSDESLYKELTKQLPIQYSFSAEEVRLYKSPFVEAGKETFTKIFLVVPFLKCVGWIPELMEFERYTKNGPADIVLYEDLMHKKPFAIVETKRAGSALGSWALQQAIGYADAMDENPKLILATDGNRYVFSRYGEEEIFEIDRYSRKMNDEDCILFLHPSTYPSKQEDSQ